MPDPALFDETHTPVPPDAALEIGFCRCVEQLRKALFATPLGWILVMWVSWNGVSHWLMLFWLGGFLLTWSVSLTMLTRTMQRQIRMRRDMRKLYLAAALDGLAWGVMVPILSPENGQTFLWLIVILCGVVAINTLTYITYIRAYWVMMAGLFVMAALDGLFAFHDIDHLHAMGGLLFFIAVMTFCTYPVSQEVLESIRLQLENAELAKRLREALQMAKHDAATDALTGLANRRALDGSLAQWEREADGGARTFSLLMLDIDHFKQINDQYGHDVGDKVLQAFAERVSRQLRSEDLFARHGGEEFIILLPDTELPVAVQIGKRIRASIESTILVEEPPLHVTVSIGVAQHREEEPIDALLSRVDAAVYMAKHRGRNWVQEAY